MGETNCLVDTEGSIHADRLFEMAGDCFARVYYFRVHSIAELTCLLFYHLPLQFLPENPRIQLIVVDSIAFHFRNSFSPTEGQATNKLLKAVGCTLQHIAQGEFTNGVPTCILVTNQVTRGAGGVGAQRPQIDEDLFASLGETWSNFVDKRIRTRQSADAEWMVNVIKGKRDEAHCFYVTDIGISLEPLNFVPLEKRPRTE